MKARAAIAALLLPLLAVFVVLPLALLIARSLEGGPGVFVDALASETNRAALVNTLLAGGGAALLALVIGAPLGAAIGRLELAGEKTLATILVLPIAVPPYVWAMAWITLASPLSGWLNRPFSTPVFDVYGLPGIVWVLGLALSPLVILPVRATLEAADPALEEAARIAGAGPVRAFLTGAAPLAAPAALSGALLAFLSAISAFGVPYLLGVQAERPFLVATTRVYQALALREEADIRGAIALCGILLVIAGAATFAASRLSRARPHASKARRVARLDARGLALFASIAGWLFAIVGVILPASAIVLSALTRRFGDPPGPGNLTLGNFSAVLGRDDAARAIANSLWLGVGAASAIVVLGLALAFLRRGSHRASRGAPALARLAEAPYAIPGSVLALGFLLAFSQEIRVIFFERVTIAFAMSGTLWMLGVAYAVKYLAFGVRAAEDAVGRIDPALEEAARISGAGPARAFVDVTLPLARPALAAAWILAFLPAATELTMSVLLVGSGTPVLGTVLFDLASYADPPSAAVLACVCLAMVIAADLLLRRLQRSTT